MNNVQSSQSLASSQQQRKIAYKRVLLTLFCRWNNASFGRQAEGVPIPIFSQKLIRTELDRLQGDTMLILNNDILLSSAQKESSKR